MTRFPRIAAFAVAAGLALAAAPASAAFTTNGMGLNGIGPNGMGLNGIGPNGTAAGAVVLLAPQGITLPSGEAVAR